MNEKSNIAGLDNANYALERLRELIAVSAFGRDGKLPTERTLSERLGAGRREIRRHWKCLKRKA